MIKKLKLFHFLIIYPSLWIAYCLFEFILGRVPVNMYYILMNLIPSLLLAIVSIGFFLYYKNSIVLNKFKLFITIGFLFTLDQISKVIVANTFKSNNINSFNVIKDYFSITPQINDRGSFIASRFDISAPFILFIILNFIILGLIYFIYKFMESKRPITSMEQLSFIFLFSGGLCSLIDKIFWGGSLDFLEIHYLFIADIKDIYITFGLGCFILLTMISDDQLDLKELSNFILKSFKLLKK